ncbi:hypothetical protein [Burkholderia sp. USMB20]|nr:hypothetical protein [Burkholderia sp. USMB20]
MQLNESLGQFIVAVEYERLLDIDSRVARGVVAVQRTPVSQDG